MCRKGEGSVLLLGQKCFLRDVKSHGQAKMCFEFEILMAVTIKHGVFWVVTPCGSEIVQRFG
jgi:hypothetical protein